MTRPWLEGDGLRDAFAFSVDDGREVLAETFADFITKGTGRGDQDSRLIRLFNTCHRMTSADEKGVAREVRQMPKGDMWLATPFGYRALTLDLDAVEAQRLEMDRQLAGAFKSYLSEEIRIDALRERAIGILKPGLSRALGETRRPANDVTLWAQLHGVAALYKPALAALALGLAPTDHTQLRWRLFGVGWSGRSFVQTGRKPGDIKQRLEIVGSLVTAIEQRIEVAHAVGSRFYADLNGVFFTFPGIEDRPAEELVSELAPELVAVVRDRSAAELWPFFTLSRRRRTLTAITGEIEARDQIAAAPHVAPFLSMEQNGREGRKNVSVAAPRVSDQPLEGAGGERDAGPAPALFGRPRRAPPGTSQGSLQGDTCPVCQVRAKPVTEATCGICRQRRSFRQASWQRDREAQTIWVDEVADENNRLALLTLRIDLSRWLSGEWLTTLLSQTLDDWWSSKRMNAVRNDAAQWAMLEAAAGPLTATASVATTSIEDILTRPQAQPQRRKQNREQAGQDAAVDQDGLFRAAVLGTFFEEVSISAGAGAPTSVDQILNNLKSQIDDAPGYRVTAEDLATAVFTQHASPARLARIWEETEALLAAWIERLEQETFGARPHRLGFTTAGPVAGVGARLTYRIAVPGLEPGPLVVLCLDERDCHFLTADSLKKFRFKRNGRWLEGTAAVRCALEQGGIAAWYDEESGRPLSAVQGVTAVCPESFTEEEYLPFLVLARSPVVCQVLLPANRAAATLRQLLALVDERLGKVQGKLPLHATLLAVNRKFPLYALIEAGQQALDDPRFQEGSLQAPWWEPAAGGGDPFYGHYPTAAPGGGRYRLIELAPAGDGGPRWLTPGYFDFDFLSSTADRHRLAYEVDEDRRPVRPSIAYGWLRPRPQPLHHLHDMFEVWRLLTTQLGSTQVHQIEMALATKLDEWKLLGDGAGPVFQRFARALLRDAFGEGWEALGAGERDLLDRSATDGTLLEAIELFRHVLKEEAP